MSSARFYEELPSFLDFADIVDGQHFKRIPDDWMVVITDVRGSTEAIEEGRYKDVNTVGAAAIACVLNAVGRVEIPYVFGGDGATMVLPRDFFDAAKEQLIALRDLSQEKFGFELRVGAVSIREIEAANAHVSVGKYEFFKGGASVAIFRGGGLTKAEELVKGAGDAYLLTESTDTKLDLTGLSCRWQPIPSSRGTIMSVLVVAKDDSDEHYRSVLQAVDSAYGGNVELANPVNTSVMRYRSFAECVADEKRYHKRRLSIGYILRFIEIFVAVMIFKRGAPGMFFSSRRYKRSMQTHSDYRKFDDALRMTIDCAPNEVLAIEGVLESLHAENKICYGVHKSESSLMTCLVESLGDGGHIHFIDGSDGGYAMAAKQLKAQLKEMEWG